MAGAVLGGRGGVRFVRHRGRRLALAVAIERVLIAAATIVSIVAGGQLAADGRYKLIVLPGLAMGVQNATARKLAVPDLTTTVLIPTVTGIAADSRLAGGSGRHPGRRLVAVPAMLARVIAGAVRVLQCSVVAAVGSAAGVLLVAGSLPMGARLRLRAGSRRPE